MYKLALTIIFLFSAPLFAADTPVTTISMLRGFTSTDVVGIYLKTADTIPNPAQCASNSLIRMAKLDSADFDMQYSLILAAFAANKRVTLKIHDTECSSSYPKLINTVVYQ
ncbi:hypothetical protein [Pleionea litopenaei]|uniref:Uncharacterized protein n=1 Tax=Pleionea litopenaei TaxID=3070815 RepID=A0AA51RTN7_9GAMM|nr:hypothetical protein [Pleionea sp. HL-JVS1]WMS87501.1 hypothetical protein Q9312_00890 [Pleionea sp. HL-JVS1]